MPPSKSGIADYSDALLGEFGKLVETRVYASGDVPFTPGSADIPVYQIGNNPWHTFCYETALQHPGVVVMHEGNLHHLITDLTIRRGDWDSYLTECEFNGGATALAWARRVRKLEVGPDYEGLPMTRRLLESARGLIVHSDFVARQMREQGFKGPIATIPHGSWIPGTNGFPQPNRLATREKLGLDETTPLIGAFGYIKPYKRIAESLRALRRLVKLDPRVRMILVGEPHPEFAVSQLIRTLGLTEQVRIIGFAPIEEFVDYMAACDIILNLRYPTVGETSGSLQRAMGLGRAVIVSAIGSFAELPDDVCLKVPIGALEEDTLFEYLNILVSRPDLAQAMGARAREWVERECNWAAVAARYAAFVKEVAGEAETPIATEVVPNAPRFEEEIQPEVVETWVAPDARKYAANHKSRFVQTLEMTPAGDQSKSVLEMGAYMQITPALKFTLGYGTVRGCYYGEAGHVDHKLVTSESGESFTCDVDHFDAERDPFPYADASFETVLCCELIEHLHSDPMHMMSEINRVLKPGGHLVLTTPNAGSLRSISAILTGYHPAFFPAYIRPRNPGEESEARHNREYVPMEIQHLLTNSGFEIVKLETGEFLEEPHPELAWVTHLLQRYKLGFDLRGDGIYVLGRKAGPVVERWPDWLYQ
jgi:glycosyltransferase involved in cell wall biosynthesis